MPALNGSTFLRNPQTGEIESLAAGSELPEWAVGLVGGHLLVEPEVIADEKPKRPRAR